MNIGIETMILAARAKMSLDTMLIEMSTGMIETLKIFFLTLLFSLPLGMIVAFGRMSRFRIVRWIFSVYISIMRGTPLMLQVMAVYFGPNYLFDLKVPREYRFIAIIIAFALNYAAYFAEIYRSGIQAMSVGQYEAAGLLGYSKAQTFFKIILPQVIKNILPAVTNEIICLVKDTSLAFSISYMEMFSIAKQIAAADTSMMPFLIAAIFYFIFNALVAWVMDLLEKKLNYYN